MKPKELAGHIDHTLLKPEATREEVARLCEQAVSYGFFAACVNPVHVAFCVRKMEELIGQGEASPVVISVAGFPLGATHPATKADEARRALDNGAREIDMVAQLGALRDGDGRTVRNDIEAVARVLQEFSGARLKVILETRALGRERIILGCRCCAEAQVDFVKTSTGLHPAGGATVDDVSLLYRCASPIRVKAAGGIRTAADALAMIDAGAVRIGTSASCTIVDEYAAMLLK